MKLQCMKEILQNIEKMHQLLDEDFVDEALQLIDQNEILIQKIQALTEAVPTESENEVATTKQQLLIKNEQFMNRLKLLQEKRKPELVNMSQKVYASQAYNNMRRNLY